MAGLTDYYTDVLGVDPSELKYIDDDFVGVRLHSGKTFAMAFGDPVRVLERNDDDVQIEIIGGSFHGSRARVRPSVKFRDTPLFRFSMVDVQQGDGMVVETPGGKIILIDGGDNQLLARHLAARFARTTPQKRLHVDAMIVTHGDADHFSGLTEIKASEKLESTPEDPRRATKRLFITVDQVFHNGLAKRPTKLPDKTARPVEEMFGRTATRGTDTFCTELVDDLDSIEAAELNGAFRKWVAALRHWGEHGRIACSRVSQHKADRLRALFDEPGLKVDVLGPITEMIGGREALLFLREPRKSTEMHLSDDAAVTGRLSASHTINGHSIAMRIHAGNVRFLLTGDLNQQAMAHLRAAIPSADFECEILKAPHHGSHDFDFRMLEEAKPVVSLISSGDESTSKEYIHPRATLLSALGKVSRGPTGVVFITELAAFFSKRGPAKLLDTSGKPTATFDPKKPFFAFERTNFGIVHIRTDGHRVLAFTHSGKEGVNEGYGFDVDAQHRIKWHPSLRIRNAPSG